MFARAMLRGIVRILDSWEAASSRREEGLRDDVSYEMPLASGREDGVTVSCLSSSSNFMELSKCGEENSFPCAEVTSESKSQEVLFDNSEPSGSPGEGEAVKGCLEDAAKEAAKDDMGFWLVKKPCEVVAYEEKADTLVEEKADMPSEECEESKPIDDTTCKSTRDVLVVCESTLF